MEGATEQGAVAPSTARCGRWSKRTLAMAFRTSPSAIPTAVKIAFIDAASGLSWTHRHRGDQLRQPQGGAAIGRCG